MKRQEERASQTETERDLSADVIAIPIVVGTGILAFAGAVNYLSTVQQAITETPKATNEDVHHAKIDMGLCYIPLVAAAATILIRKKGVRLMTMFCEGVADLFFDAYDVRTGRTPKTPTQKIN